MNDYSLCHHRTSVVGIAPDEAVIAAHLSALPHERIVVAAINPDTRQTISFTIPRAELAANVKGLAEVNARGWNLHFRPPEYEGIYSGFTEVDGEDGKKIRKAHHPKKEDAKIGYGAHVDIDPPASLKTEAERAEWRQQTAQRLQADGATLVWCSGRGIWGWWQFREPIKLGEGGMPHEQFEEVNVGKASAHGGDKCHDCGHLGKLAGTIAWPGEKKLKEGYGPTLSYIISHRPEMLHDWSALPREKPKSKGGERASGGDAAAGLVNIDRAKSMVGKIKPEHLAEVGVGSDTIQLAHVGPGEENIGDGKKYPTKSEVQWKVCLDFERAKLDRDAHAAILMDPAWWVHQTIKEHGGWQYAERQIRKARAQVGDLPEVQLPGGERSHVDCARELGPILRGAGVYSRGGIPAIIDASGRVATIKGARGVSLLERHCRFFVITPAKPAKPAVKSKKDETGQVVVRAKPAVEAQPAEKVYMNALDPKMVPVLLSADELIDALPPINVVTRCPILLDEGGKLVPITSYHEASGILVNGGEAPPEVPFEVAARIIASKEGLLRDFIFHDEEDFAKAVVTLLSPCLNLGGMLAGVGTKPRVPMPVLLKDDSQAGGGYFVKMLCAIHNEDAPEFVTQRGEGGVGSDRETFETALTRGRPIVCFDNWKGILAIQSAEQAMTEDSVPCRVPGVASINIDPRRIFFVMTSNGATLSRDMSNRSYLIHMKKRPDKLPDGSMYPEPHKFDGTNYLLEYVRINQPFILGCVWSILRRWYELGKHVYTGAKRHDFDAWERAVVFIATEMLGLVDPLASSRKQQGGIASNTETWVREAAIAIRKEGLLGKQLTAAQIYAACEEQAVEVPGAKRPEEGPVAVGRKIGPAFRQAEEREENGTKVRKITLGGFDITRMETTNQYGDNERTYFFDEKGTEAAQPDAAAWSLKP